MPETKTKHHTLPAKITFLLSYIMFLYGEKRQMSFRFPSAELPDLKTTKTVSGLKPDVSSTREHLPNTVVAQASSAESLC